MTPRYLITELGNQGQWIINDGENFVGEYSSLAAALAYLATVLVFGDTIAYLNEPAGS